MTVSFDDQCKPLTVVRVDFDEAPGDLQVQLNALAQRFRQHEAQIAELKAENETLRVRVGELEGENAGLKMENAALRVENQRVSELLHRV